MGADLLGLALVVFDLATGAPVARDRGRLLPVEADLGSEGQDVRGVQTLRPCPKWARDTAVRRNKAAYDNRYISVLTLRDREVVHWRDYLDPIAVFDALGWPPR